MPDEHRCHQTSVCKDLYNPKYSDELLPINATEKEDKKERPVVSSIM